MTKKIRVGAVSYLNTRPLIYGFEQGLMKDDIELVIGYPSKIAAALLNDEIDIGLVPVAAIPEMKEYHIIGDHCIACDGEVASVCLFSEVPLEEIETVLLDYQSRTSVKLAEILLKQYWKIKPELQKTSSDFRASIKGTTAAILIGDNALQQRTVSKYKYDLGAAWKDLTGLPFVFAAWISNKPLSSGFIDQFNEANEIGLQNIDAVVKANPYTIFDLESYYTRFIHYHLDDSNRQGLDLFLQKIKPLAAF